MYPLASKNSEGGILVLEGLRGEKTVAERTLKEKCVWQHRFTSFQEAEQVISEWIRYYNEERMHSRLGYRSPRAFYELTTLRKKSVDNKGISTGSYPVSKVL
ncbi:MAG: transposase [Firmicutes bacterium]|nr:transposase [Bacillota bacterium]